MADGTRIVLADDHRIFVDALAAQLEAEPDLAVVGRAHSVRSTERMVTDLRPDVLLVDVEFEDGDGIELARRLRVVVPGTNILVLTAHDDTAVASKAVRASVAGFLSKDVSRDELIDAIRWARGGGAWIQPRILRGVLDDLLRGIPPPTPDQVKLERLTDRELEVLREMVRGRDRNAIAQQLYVSKNTVRTHIRNLLAKLEAHSSLEAVTIGVRAGLGKEDASSPGALRQDTARSTRPNSAGATTLAST